jgi:hypothetical protein
VGARKLAAVGLMVGGTLAAVAPFLPWFRVACCGDVASTESLVATSYGSFMTFLGLVALGCGAAQLHRWEPWGGWAAVGAVAMVFVLAAGLRGMLDPLGAAKESLRPASPVVEAAGISTARGYRERVQAAFDRGDLGATALVGGWVAAAAGAVGASATLPRLIARRTSVGGPR